MILTRKIIYAKTPCKWEHHTSVGFLFHASFIALNYGRVCVSACEEEHTSAGGMGVCVCACEEEHECRQLRKPGC